MKKAYAVSKPLKLFPTKGVAPFAFELMTSSRFIPPDFVTELRSYRYGVSWGDRGSVCQLWWGQSSKPSAARIASLSRTFSATLSFLADNFSSVASMEAVIFWCPRPKLLPSDHSVQIEPRHINSGICSGKRVCVFRSEDVRKVLIHEMLHAAGVSFQVPETIVRQIAREWRVGTPLLVNEAVVEYVARIAVCGATTASAETVKKRRKQMNSRAILIAERVLRHFGRGPFKETTNAFCYVVLCAALLNYGRADLLGALGKLRARKSDYVEGTDLRLCPFW